MNKMNYIFVFDEWICIAYSLYLRINTHYIYIFYLLLIFVVINPIILIFRVTLSSKLTWKNLDIFDSTGTSPGKAN